MYYINYIQKIPKTDNVKTLFKGLSQRANFRIYFKSFDYFISIKSYIIAITNYNNIHFYSQDLYSKKIWNELFYINIKDIVNRESEINEIKNINVIISNDEYIIFEINNDIEIFFIKFDIKESKCSMINSNYLDTIQINKIEYYKESNSFLISYLNNIIKIFKIKFFNNLLELKLEKEYDLKNILQPFIEYRIINNIYYFVFYHSIIKIMDNENIEVFNTNSKIIGLLYYNNIYYVMTREGELYYLIDENKYLKIMKTINNEIEYDGDQKFTGLLLSPNHQYILSTHTLSKRECTIVFNKFVSHTSLFKIKLEESNDILLKINNILKYNNYYNYVDRRDIIWTLKDKNDENSTLNKVLDHLLQINTIHSLRFYNYLSIILKKEDLNTNIILCNLLFRFKNYLELPKESKLQYSLLIQRYLATIQLIDHNNSEILSYINKINIFLKENKVFVFILFRLKILK